MKLATTTLFFCVAALLSLGMVILYSSSTAQVGAHYLKMQLVWCALGLVGATLAATLDYHHLKKLSLPLLALAIVLLLLVFAPHIGIKVKGAHRWIGHGGIRFQPSELAKIALIIFIAYYGERFQRQMGTFGRGLVIPGIVISLILGMIFIEPDRGCTILLAAVTGTMLIIAGVRLKF
ncbi:MAG: FtsW/RodA/SpoVE family cell cycle protein, partial [Verrucomicrobiota bacterium]